MILDFQSKVSKSFQPIFYDEQRYLILYGGAGSGKSHSAAQKIIYRCLTEKVNHKFLVMRKTSPSVKDSCFALINHYLNEWNIPHDTINLNIKFMGNEILFKGIDDPDKIKSIEGITGLWLEEATEFTRADFNQLDLRLRGKINTYKQMMMSFNPVGGKSSWLYKMFFDTQNPNAKIFHSTYKDNDFLDEEYIKKLEDIQDETFHKIYTKGQWAELKNAIWSNYIKEDLDVNEVLKKADAIYGGIDFGFNNPSAFLLIAEHDKEVYILKELYQTGLTNTELITRVKIQLKGLVGVSGITLWGDAAEPARILEFNQQGLHTLAADKSVKDGIDEVKRRKIHINTECVNASREIPFYSYIEDKDGNVKEEPIKMNDHTCDALRYGVYNNSRQGIIISL